MKSFSIFTIFLLIFALVSCGQTTKNKPFKSELKALATFISDEGGDKIHISKYKIIKDFTDTTFADTINVGYYFYKRNSQQIDTVLLTLTKYDGQSKIDNYFICPDYDAKLGIQKAKINFIDFNYWEGCETGQGECKPLSFSKAVDTKNCFLIMPCGGTETAISILSNDGVSIVKELHLFGVSCPPYLELTNLKDGKYFAQMRACGLGGTVEFNLKTSK